MFIHALESPGLVKIGVGGPHAVTTFPAGVLGSSGYHRESPAQKHDLGAVFRRPHRLTLHHPEAPGDGTCHPPVVPRLHVSRRQGPAQGTEVLRGAQECFAGSPGVHGKLPRVPPPRGAGPLLCRKHTVVYAIRDTEGKGPVCVYKIQGAARAHPCPLQT